MTVRGFATAEYGSARPAWPRWPLLLALLVLWAGPLAAPLFQATHVPELAATGQLARDLLAAYICPTPAKSYLLFGFPMAVCARCWGATFGLWLAYGLMRKLKDGRRWTVDGGRWTVALAACAPRRLRSSVFRLSSAVVTGYLALAWPLQLLLSALPFLLWPLEISLWPAAPYWLLLLNGMLAGWAAGLFFCARWPGLVQHAH